MATDLAERMKLHCVQAGLAMAGARATDSRAPVLTGLQGRDVVWRQQASCQPLAWSDDQRACLARNPDDHAAAATGNVHARGLHISNAQCILPA